MPDGISLHLALFATERTVEAVTQAVTSLAGLPKEHISAQMRAFRDGKRSATVMHQIAKGYTDAQIDSLAQWYAEQKR